MLTDEIRHLARLESSRCSLPLRLVTAIVQVESGGDPGATRFESGFKRRYIVPLKLPEPEATHRATSWGLMQIMGETAYSVGFRGDYANLLDPATGLHWGCEYLRRLRDRYRREPWEVICRAYNGGPGNRHNRSNTYPAKVLAACGGVWPPKE